MTENCAALLHNRFNGSENENIIKSLAAGKAAEHAHGIVAGGIYIVKLNAEFLGILRSVYGCGAGKSCIVNVGDNQKGGMNIAVNGIVDCTKSHRTCAGKNGHFTVLDDVHFMSIVVAGNVVPGGMKSAGDTCHRLGKGAVEKGVSGVIQKAAKLHNLVGNDNIGGVAADVSEGITGSGINVLGVVKSRLNGNALTLFKVVCPFTSHLNDLAAELVSYDGGVFGHVVGHALMLCALDGGLVGGHTNAVGYHLEQYLVLLHLGKFKFLKAQVVFTVNSYCFCFHFKDLL